MYDGPLVSVLLPSRKRVDLLEKSLRSVGWPDDPRVEWIVALDENDPFLPEYKKLLGDTAYIVTEQYGYIALHEYYNLLSEICIGQWLMLWNDDAFMESPDWLDKIAGYDPNQPLVLNIYKPDGNLFPLISRKLYEILGHYSLSPHNDTWVQEISRRLGIERFVRDVHVKHIVDSLKDDLAAEMGSVRDKSNALHHSMEKELAEDVDKVRSYMEENK